MTCANKGLLNKQEVIVKQFLIICCLMSLGLYGQFEWKPNADGTIGFYLDGRPAGLSLPPESIVIAPGNKAALTGKDTQGLKFELPELKLGDNFVIFGEFSQESMNNFPAARSSILVSSQSWNLTVNRSGNQSAAGKLSFTCTGKDRGDMCYIDSVNRVDDGKLHRFALILRDRRAELWVDGVRMLRRPVFTENTNAGPHDDTFYFAGGPGGLAMTELGIYNYVPAMDELGRLSGMNMGGAPHPVPFVQKVLVKPDKPQMECWVVPPISNIMRLPDTPPVDGKKTNRQTINLTPGEYEPASIVIAALTDLPGVTVTVAVPDGFAANDIDLCTVKCHYQAGTAWKDIRMREGRVLTPELLLKDDSLVMVDYQNQRNYVRLDGQYVDMSQPEPANQPGMSNDEFPVRDTETLQPFDIPKGEYKQLWITVHAPETIPAGLYRVSLQLICNGQVIHTQHLDIRVLPFRLAELKNYDLDKPFYSSIYYKGILGKRGAVSGWDKTKEQYRADLKNMRTHGVNRPMIHQLEREWDFAGFEEALRIRQEEGISNEPLFLLGRERNLGAGNTEDPQKIDEALDKLRQIRTVTDRFNIKELYIYGIDESTGDLMKAQKTIWRAFQQQPNTRVYQAGFLDHKPPAVDLVGDTLDVMIAMRQTARKYAAPWHKNGKAIWSYGNPQGGVEDPEIYRRNYGLELWRNRYDGACTYAYHHGYGHSWNDFDHPTARDHNLTYPTANGVIDTIAWEGYREGIDDIRYGVTLKESIARAANSTSGAKRKLAVEAADFLEKCDLRNRDLDTVRLQIIDYILKLEK